MKTWAESESRARLPVHRPPMNSTRKISPVRTREKTKRLSASLCACILSSSVAGRPSRAVTVARD
ncbi:MAG: hypothetical protein MZV63_65680 [Marinilabiliales bacterium]|nr:hypothetical protein [Marinilabiliales bacterium]